MQNLKKEVLICPEDPTLSSVGLKKKIRIILCRFVHANLLEYEGQIFGKEEFLQGMIEFKIVFHRIEDLNMPKFSKEKVRDWVSF